MILPTEKQFRSRDGTVIKSMNDLLNEFEKYAKGINTDTFYFHKQNSRNDYSNWIRYVFNEEELANKLRDVKSPEEARDLLKEELSKRQENPLTEKEYDDKILDKGEAINDRATKLKKRTNAKITPEEKKLDALKDQYDDLYSAISENRRQGKDVFIPSLKLRHAIPKIKYYAATAEESAYKHAMELLEEVKKELEESISYEEIDLRKEILEAAKEKD